MGLALRQFKVYLKLGSIVVGAVLILLIVLMNRRNTADIWVFKTYEDVNVLLLILVTAVASVISWWAVRKIFRIIRELREVQRLKQSQVQLDEQRRLAQELADREKRIDEKVRRSITEEP